MICQGYGFMNSHEVSGAEKLPGTFAFIVASINRSQGASALSPVQVVHFSRDAVRTMVRKLPVLLNWETANLERKIDDMRQLAYTR